jgi:hypothetical protein
MATYVLSPLTSETYGLLGARAQSKSIQQYEIVKIGRREFLIIGGTVMAAVVGSALYYVSPAFRTLTMTVTSTVAESATIRTTETTRTPEATINTYRMTASTIWYYMPAQMGQEYEMHFKTTRRGKIEDVRSELVSEGTAYFQKTICEESGRRIPKKRIRIGFEREEPATKVQNNIMVEARYMEYQDGKWKSAAIPSEVLTHA